MIFIQLYVLSRYNDQPHGLFGVQPEQQTVIVDPDKLTRQVRLNFTRYQGAFGNVILTYSIKYDLVSTSFSLCMQGNFVLFCQCLHIYFLK